MTAMEQNRTSNSLVFYQLILYVAMISGYKGIAYYISLVAIFLFFVEILATNKGKLPTNKSWNHFMLFMAFYIVTSLFNLNVQNLYVYSAYYILVFFPILICEYLKMMSSSMILRSLKCFLIVFACFCIIAIGFYIANPGLAREMAGQEIEDQMAIGGGYLLAYAAAILGVYFFSKLINKRISRRPAYIVFCIICVCVVYLTQSSITTLAMFIGIVISLIMKGRETSGNPIEGVLKIGFIGIFVFILVCVIVYNKYAIAEWVLDFIEGKDSNVLFKRIGEIVNSFVYGKKSWHYEDRTETLTESIALIKQYPIFGVGYKYGYVYSQGMYWGLGNHSEILDALARYGIVGGVLWLSPYFRTLKQIFRKNLGCAITILMLMYFNPFVSFHSNAVMFFFIPLCEEILRRRNQHEQLKEIGEEEGNAGFCDTAGIPQ